MQFKYRVTMDDGATWEVTVDQRDVARFEVHPDGVPFNLAVTRPYTYARFLAWHAGRRDKLHRLTWEQFCDKAVDVEGLNDEQAAEADPGQSAASADT